MSSPERREAIREKLQRESTEELERRLNSSKQPDLDELVAIKSILRERYAKPDRHVALWTLAFSAIAAATGVLALFWSG